MAKAYKKYCDLLHKLDGVLNVKFVDDQEGNIVELHVLASKSIHPKQLVRNIESALLSKYDFTIDRKIISIAQIESELYALPERLKFQALNLRYTSTSEVLVSVELQKDNEIYAANESANTANTDIKLAVGNAAITAVHQYIEHKEIFKLIKIHTEILCEREIVICVVSYSEAKNTEELLVGTCFVTSDMNIATVKAILNAVNRKICLLNLKTKK
jgi:hypothetical protein